jgi:hypothetical protein
MNAPASRREGGWNIGCLLHQTKTLQQSAPAGTSQLAPPALAAGRG